MAPHQDIDNGQPQAQTRSTRRRASTDQPSEPAFKRRSTNRGVAAAVTSASREPGLVGDLSCCECGDPNKDGLELQCDECTEWRHQACYGFHEGNNAGIEDRSISCFRCKIYSGVTREERIKGTKDEAVSDALDRLRQLCTFRRALLIVYVGFDVSVSSYSC